MEDLDDILSLAIESSGIASETERQGNHGAIPNPSLESLFGGAPPNRTGPDLGSLLATATPNAPPTQDRRLISGDGSGQYTAPSGLPPVDINPFAAAQFGVNQRFSIEEVLNAVIDEPPTTRSVGTADGSSDLADLFAQPTNPIMMSESLSSELDMALDAALFGSADIPVATSSTLTPPQDMLFPSPTTSVPQFGKQTPPTAVSVPPAVRHLAAPSPLVYSTVAPPPMPRPATSAPARPFSQPAALPAAMMASSRAAGQPMVARQPM